MKKLLILLALVGCSKEQPDVEQTSQWIASVVEYRPAPGQFINTSLGNLSAAEGLVGKKGEVSLGGFGGYIVIKFGGAVKNIEKTDFVIHGNSFAESSEAGAVAVSVDANGDGLANDEWFELRASAFDTSIRGYRIEYHKPTATDVAEDVEWTDNQGGSGTMTDNEFHNQSYWPLFLSGQTLVFEGNLVKNAPKQVGNLWISVALGWGYADNFSSDYGATVGGDKNTANSNKFDISDAVNAKGEAVELEKIDFVKVYNCQREQAPLIGDISTDVCGAIALKLF